MQCGIVCCSIDSSGPSTSRKHGSMTLPPVVDKRTFFGRGDDGCHHSHAHDFGGWIKGMTRVSLAAMTLERNWFPISWYRIMCCMETDMR
ncbi:hypothetical protein NPIL_585411 [Nephila pilipes]|uniref:Uncharacterized protein n=1 Tax=Nephila pilipes TaxID=299642 RepID=A0A8X6QJB2_NEPPI|nr:hypothetical protein NPIL_585411 [Nephila pilipes]